MALQHASSNPDPMVDLKEDVAKETEEHEHIAFSPGAAHQFDAMYKSKWEDLDRIKTLKLFWKMALVCFAVAFSAAADGYQVGLPELHASLHS